MADTENTDSFKQLIKNIGLKCANRRKFLNISQTRLSEILNFQSTNFLSRVENGHENVFFKTFYAISEALKLRPFEMLLFHDVKEMTKEEMLGDLYAVINHLKTEDVKIVLNLSIELLKKITKK